MDKNRSFWLLLASLAVLLAGIGLLALFIFPAQAGTDAPDAPDEAQAGWECLNCYPNSLAALSACGSDKITSKTYNLYLVYKLPHVRRTGGWGVELPVSVTYQPIRWDWNAALGGWTWREYGTAWMWSDNANNYRPAFHNTLASYIDNFFINPHVGIIGRNYYETLGIPPRTLVVEPGVYSVRMNIRLAGQVYSYNVPFIGPAAQSAYLCVVGSGTQLNSLSVAGTPPLDVRQAYLPLTVNRNDGYLQPTPVPTTTPMPITLPAPSLPSTTQGIADPGFEGGPNGAWQEFSEAGFKIVMKGPEGYPARSGEYLAWLGGTHNETSTISQVISVPATHPFLSMYVYNTSTEDECIYDVIRVTVNGANVNTTGLCKENKFNGWRHGIVDLRPHAGKSVTLELGMNTDASLLSSLFIDDLSFLSGIEAQATPTPGPTATPPPAPSPTPMPGPNAIRNPGFEQGNNGDWTTYSKLGYPSIYNHASARSGGWMAWLGGLNGETGSIQQTFTVPSAQPVLTYWGWIRSEQAACGGDKVEILVNGGVVGGYNLCAQTRTESWGQGWINLSAYKGTTITLQLRVLTDGEQVSSLFLDDFAFAAAAPSAQAAPAAAEAAPAPLALPELPEKRLPLPEEKQ